MIDQGTIAGFRTTRWSLVDRLRAGEADGRAAADAIARIYWPAVYGWLRRHGRREEDASEVTQAFFAKVVVPRRLFERADPGHGRLRSLIIAALKRFLIDLHRRDAARGGSARSVQLAPEPEGAASRDLFDQLWATASVAEALRRVEQHFHERGREGHWLAFERRVLGPAIRAVEPPPLPRIYVECGFASPALAAAAVQTVKRRFEAVLREIVAETIAEDSAGDVEDEVRHLRTVLSPEAGTVG